MTDGSSDDMGGSLLRMLDSDQTYALNYADGELNTSKGIMSIKKSVMQDRSVDTKSGNAYQKALPTETENDKKKNPTQMKKMVHIE